MPHLLTKVWCVGMRENGANEALTHHGSAGWEHCSVGCHPVVSSKWPVIALLQIILTLLSHVSEAVNHDRTMNLIISGYSKDQLLTGMAHTEVNDMGKIKSVSIAYLKIRDMYF